MRRFAHRRKPVGRSRAWAERSPARMPQDAPWMGLRAFATTSAAMRPTDRADAQAWYARPALPRCLGAARPRPQVPRPDRAGRLRRRLRSIATGAAAPLRDRRILEKADQRDACWTPQKDERSTASRSAVEAGKGLLAKSAQARRDACGKSSQPRGTAAGPRRGRQGVVREGFVYAGQIEVAQFQAARLAVHAWPAFSLQWQAVLAGLPAQRSDRGGSMRQGGTRMSAYAFRGAHGRRPRESDRMAGHVSARTGREDRTRSAARA